MAYFVKKDFQKHFNFPVGNTFIILFFKNRFNSIGRKGSALFDENLQANLKRILEELGEVIQTAKRIRMVLDDSPTKWYGLKIEGALYHHNPTPGRTKAKICFGHSWVVAALVIIMNYVRK